mgnify:CR=1 FL=1
MNFIQNYFQKRNNNIVANLDYELAEQFMNADFKFVERDLDENGQYDGISIGKKLGSPRGFWKSIGLVGGPNCSGSLKLLTLRLFKLFLTLSDKGERLPSYGTSIEVPKAVSIHTPK